MAQGIVLTIGLNRVNPAKYGSISPLRGCVNDARDMAKIALAKGFKFLPGSSGPLEDSAATRMAVGNYIRAAAEILTDGDIFFVHYSGHGTQVDDTNSDEPDRQDEAWCLFDNIMIDDELRAFWARFKPGVRIVMFSDSCHSGTMAREIANELAPSRDLGDPDDPLVPQRVIEVAEVQTTLLTGEEVMFRLLPEEGVDTLRRDPDSFSENMKEFRSGGLTPLDAIKASVLSISGCADNQLSSDLTSNGAFTAAVKGLLDSSRNYNALGKAAGAKLKQGRFNQTPHVESFGTFNADFLDEPPLTI